MLLGIHLRIQKKIESGTASVEMLRIQLDFHDVLLMLGNFVDAVSLIVRNKTGNPGQPFGSVHRLVQSLGVCTYLTARALLQHFSWWWSEYAVCNQLSWNAILSVPLHHQKDQ